jgi:cytochrome P450
MIVKPRLRPRYSMPPTIPSVPDVPTLPALLLLKNLYGDFPNFLRETSARYGPIVRFAGTLRLTRQNLYFVNEPAAIEEILVSKGTAFEKSRGARRLRQIVGKGLLTSDEPQHLAHRRLIQPAFHRKRLEEFARVMASATTKRVESWREGESIDVDAEMNRLALEIVSNALFGVDLRGDMDEIARSLDVALGMYHFWQSPFTELLDDWPLPNVLRFKAARQRLRGVVIRIVAQHRAEGIERGDLVSMLLAARDENGRGGLSDESVRDEALTILLAGHETTANALAWTFYVLQRRPDVEAALQCHVDAVIGDRPVTFDDVGRLDYVRAVFAETMRLYPPAWITSREALVPVTIGGVALRAGDLAIISPYVTHRDPRFWPDPERYDPSRFLGAIGGHAASEQKPRERYAYFPFGGGSRMCIGDSFAWTEGVIALATIAQNVRLERIGSGDVEPRALVTLRPRTPIAARVRRRRSPASPLPCEPATQVNATQA